jgi:hypothetical protein
VGYPGRDRGDSVATTSNASFIQAGIGAPQEEAADGRNNMKKQARAPTSAVEYRHINYSKFVFTADTYLVSYVPKKGIMSYS